MGNAGGGGGMSREGGSLHVRVKWHGDRVKCVGGGGGGGVVKRSTRTKYEERSTRRVGLNCVWGKGWLVRRNVDKWEANAGRDEREGVGGWVAE
jgi:hypothetical protein